jgi:hypothetical protein
MENRMKLTLGNRLRLGTILAFWAIGAVLACAQGPSVNKGNALARLLQSKGILSADEVAMVNRASTPEEANTRIAHLLVEKGLISQQEYAAMVGPASPSEAAPSSITTA